MIPDLGWFRSSLELGMCHFPLWNAQELDEFKLSKENENISLKQKYMIKCTKQ